MTAQFPEKIIYQGEELAMCTEPDRARDLGRMGMPLFPPAVRHVPHPLGHDRKRRAKSA